MKRSRSGKPLRRASSPDPRPQTPLKVSMSKAATSPSLGSHSGSQLELRSRDSTPTPHSSWYDEQGCLNELQKWELESSFESWPQDHLEYEHPTSQEIDLRSRSMQMQLRAEQTAPNEPVIRTAFEAPLEENAGGEELWFDFQRLLGTPSNRSSFLASMAVLVGVCFILGVIASLAAKAGQGEKGNNLELIPDAFDNDQEVLACENSDVTVSTTRPEKTLPMTAARRKATVSRRERSATVGFASRKSATIARKVGRAAPRRRRRLLKSTTRKRSVLSSTSRRLKITTRKKKRQHTAAAKARRHGTGSLAMRKHVTTKKGQRSSVTTEAPDTSIREQSEQNVVAAIADDPDLAAGPEPGMSSMISRSRTSPRAPRKVSTLKEDDEFV
ncbi:uncharacterized protein LOC119188149 [Rhipicephalus microplus]|uniref:uncharacterized protein LOC119188149 n=1 Tax=Rhipicephalus microplus TaxID=6941 RepID=UPI003F6D96AB